ncbi:MAG: TonB-linked SusC/RagA family outer membrane protein [Saprospiraceae bacterium]|jgi:TonB-linked SusC/RagA family outer membrane protein
MKKNIYIYLFFLLNVAVLSAQEKKFTGTVVDEIGITLPGATVAIIGSEAGTATDIDGVFSIAVKESDVITVSFIGYKTKEIPVAGKNNITISLELDASTLDEVVIVSFGKQKKRNVISSVTTIKPSELKVPSSNLTTALAGRVSGLIGFQRGGEPGQDNADFFVRGITSFGANNSPLILIDGVELTIDDLRRLHPDDIEAFSILKDASATALYGARGANGVVFVTMKEGKEGPMKVTARFETSYSMPTQNIELADPITYMLLGNEAVRTRDPLAPLPYSQQKIENTILGNNPELYPTTDWYGELFKAFAVNKRLNFSLSGGGGTARYYLSVAGRQDLGVLSVPDESSFDNNVNFNSYNIRSSTNLNLTKTSKLKVSFNANFEKYTGPRAGGSSVYNSVLRTNPVEFRPFYKKDESNEFTNHILFGNILRNGSLLTNPFAELASGVQETSSSKVIAQLQFNQDLGIITDGLEYRAIFNTTNNSTSRIDRFNTPFYYAPTLNSATGITSLRQLNPLEGADFIDFQQSGRAISTTTYFESNFSYNKEIDDKNEVSGLLVYTLNNRLNTLTDEQLADNSLNSSELLELSLPFRNMGVSGRFTYARSQKYFAELNFGYNGSERFAKNERWGFFPSAALGWLVTDEPFMSSTKDIITKLKLKASYGLVGNDNLGNDIDRFFYLSVISFDGNGYTTGEEFDNPINGVSISRYGNNDITWETAKKVNLGIELGLVNNFDLELDIFSEKRENILASRVIPSSLGLQSDVRANIGEAKSSGVDATLVYNKSFNSDTWLQVRGNFTYATNEITKIEEPDYTDTPWLSRVGKPINQTWGFVADRLFVDQAEVDNSPEQTFGEYTGGDIKYRDINGDGKISLLDQVPIGNPTIPEIVYGAGFSLGIKNVDISCFFQGAGNSSFFINPTQTAPFVNQQQLLKAYADSHWSESNRDLYARWPRLSGSQINNNVQTSTWFMQDGAFVRLKSAEIGYSFPERFLKNKKIQKLRIYVSGTNLLVMSRFKLWVPELAGNGFNYPNQRVFNFGINVSL